jgi:hypothetical protein
VGFLRKDHTEVLGKRKWDPQISMSFEVIGVLALRERMRLEVAEVPAKARPARAVTGCWHAGACSAGVGSRWEMCIRVLELCEGGKWWVLGLASG